LAQLFNFDLILHLHPEKAFGRFCENWNTPLDIFSYGLVRLKTNFMDRANQFFFGFVAQTCVAKSGFS